MNMCCHFKVEINTRYERQAGMVVTGLKKLSRNAGHYTPDNNNNLICCAQRTDSMNFLDWYANVQLYEAVFMDKTLQISRNIITS